MALRDYWLQFGSGDPQANTGLNPTFIFFVTGAGATLAPPSITETYVGTGLYKFSYDATQTIAFLADGATTGLGVTDRYVTGVLDPEDSVINNISLLGQAVTQQIGDLASRIGQTTSSFGTTAFPDTLFGFAKRTSEFLEGNAEYVKATGTLNFLSRGSSQLLATKTITDNSTDTEKT